MLSCSIRAATTLVRAAELGSRQSAISPSFWIAAELHYTVEIVPAPFIFFLPLITHVMLPAFTGALRPPFKPLVIFDSRSPSFSTVMRIPTPSSFFQCTYSVEPRPLGPFSRAPVSSSHRQPWQSLHGPFPGRAKGLDAIAITPASSSSLGSSSRSR
jgi:hypothetical protein